ncbi:MAG TPA: PQQ-binding-like beta-propeller repeat protein [Streptosporangiaceae bacterium]|nr:PQQ-binding-like beta-propeller repeat protein [Streptosporangiaceae bacterium]
MKRRRGWLRILVVAMTVSAVACTSSGTVTALPVKGIAHPTAAQLNWPTFGRIAARSGVSITSPSPRNVRKSWTRSVDGLVYAQPLIVGSEVIIATENDTVYALSESSGRVRWRRHLARPVTGGLPCAGNVNPSGITGTPVADPATGRLFVVTYTSHPAFRHTLWALNLTNGRTVWHRPIDVPGSDPRAQQERGALALLGSRVYVPFGGLFGDCSDYKGRVAGAPVSGFGRLVSFTTPNRREAGIWAPAGESVRGGSIYVATGNGSPINKIDDSDSVLRLSQRLKVIGRFTPSNWPTLSANDTDLASTAPAMLPGGLVFQVGKEGVGYVLNGTRLGGTGGQLASANVCEGGFGGDAVAGRTVVFSCFSSLHAISVRTGRHGRRPAIRRLWSISGSPGPPIIAGGVVWDVSKDNVLSGYRLSDGKTVFSTSTAPVVTSFPSLAASSTRLVVPEGHKVVCFVGI